MNRREASKSETRELILNAARKLFFKKDRAQQPTMRDIAAEAGVSPASVVVHFKNKKALMDAALTEDIEQTTAKAIATLPAGKDLVLRLAHIWQAMYRFYDTHRDLYRTFISSTIFEPEDQTPNIAREKDTFLAFLVELVESEKRAGRIISDADADMLALSLFSVYIGTLILFFRYPEVTPEAATGQVIAMTRQMLTGVLPTTKGDAS